MSLSRMGELSIESPSFSPWEPLPSLLNLLDFDDDGEMYVELVNDPQYAYGPLRTGAPAQSPLSMNFLTKSYRTSSIFWLGTTRVLLPLRLLVAYGAA